MMIFDAMQDYCEARQFRLTVQDDKFHLVWVVGNKIRSQSFDDWSDVREVVDTRNV